jgi:flavin-dependent dehydrogenase
LEIASSDMRVNLKAAYGIAVSRTLMDVALIESAIHRGTAFLPEATALVSPINDLGDTREVQISFGEKTVLAQTRTIVCADGLQNSSLRRLTDLSTHVSADSHVGVGGSLAQCPGSIQPQTIHMALHNQGYVGMVRLVDNSLNLAAAINPAFLKSHDSVSAAIADIVQRVGFHELTEEFLNGATWLGTTPLTHSPTRLHDHRLLIVGDAAGYIEPFTGEGMAWGITGGVSASRIVDQHLESWDESANRNWERSYQRIVGSRRFWCRSIASALRRPWLVKSILRVLNCAPFLTTPMIRSINRMPTDLQEVEGQSAQKKSPLNERAS